MKAVLCAIARIEIWCAIALGAAGDTWAAAALRRLRKLSESFPRGRT